MRDPVNVEQFLNEEIDYNQKKINEHFTAIEYRRGYAEGLEKARETLDELCNFYAQALKEKDQEILSLQCQLVAQDEEYQKEVEEWLNAPMGKYMEVDINQVDEKNLDEHGYYVPDEDVERGRPVDETGALIEFNEEGE